MDYVLLPADDEGRGSDPGRCQDTEQVAQVRDEQITELMNERTILLENLNLSQSIDRRRRGRIFNLLVQ